MMPHYTVTSQHVNNFATSYLRYVCQVQLVLNIKLKKYDCTSLLHLVRGLISDTMMPIIFELIVAAKE